MQALGVGVVYWPILDPLLREPGSPATVVEIEPQAFWEMSHDDRHGWRYRPNEALLDELAALPQAKLIHGVGHPVGGTVTDPLDHLNLLQDAVTQLAPAWVSEHLSLNRFERPQGGHEPLDQVEHAGFLLPPSQTPATTRVAADNLQRLRSAMDRPMAFETGVNYLRPQAGEMSDGDFFAAVAETSDCGIVLDLHNLWCNACNGRQSVDEVMARLPLERVWEVHLAGGMRHGAYWLDAHNGRIPEPVIELAARWIPKLPALGALMFEILPEHVPTLGLDEVAQELNLLQTMWALRAPRLVHVAQGRPAPPATGHSRPEDRAAVRAWECQLAAALHGEAPADAALTRDPGCALLARLIQDFRRANLTRALRFTLTTLLLGLGEDDTEALLQAYARHSPPQPFAALEAEQFAAFVWGHIGHWPHLPHLCEVLAFEHALIRASVHGHSTQLHWSVDPTQVLEALEAGQLPPPLPPVHSVMHIQAA